MGRIQLYFGPKTLGRCEDDGTEGGQMEEKKIKVELWSGSWAMVLACIRSVDSSIETKYPDRAKRPKRDAAGTIISPTNKRQCANVQQLKKAQRVLAKLIKAGENGDATDSLVKKLRATLEAAEYEVGVVKHWSHADFWTCIEEIEDQILK